jgi:hypothetical protein
MPREHIFYRLQKQAAGKHGLIQQLSQLTWSPEQTILLDLGGLE